MRHHGGALAIAVAIQMVFTQAMPGQELRHGDLAIELRGIIPYRTTGEGKPIYYELTFQNSMNSSRPVGVVGVGIIPEHGTIRLLTPKLEIQFWDPASNRVLETFPLKVSEIEAGDEEKTIPAESDFLGKSQFSCTCTTEADVFRRINNALNQYFLDGSVPRSLTSPWEVITIYRSIPVPNPLTARVAARFRFPIRLPDSSIGFELSRATQESRGGSGHWIPVADPRVDAKIGEFWKTFLAEVQR